MKASAMERARYMVTAAGFGEHEELEALLAWVGGGDAMKTALVLD